MEFKLSTEEIEDLINDFDISKRVIIRVETILNACEVIKDDDTYRNMVYAVASKYSSSKFIASTGKDDYMNLEEIIIYVLKTELDYEKPKSK